MTVAIPFSASRRFARSAASRTSLTPALTALSDSNEAPTASASNRAIVVLPVPAGPHRITEVSRRVSTRARNAPRGPRRWSCPRTSSRERGRSRAASGPRRARRSFRAAVNRSASAGTNVQARAPFAGLALALRPTAPLSRLGRPGVGLNRASPHGRPVPAAFLGLIGGPLS
jgi:hypothetical protein